MREEMMLFVRKRKSKRISNLNMALNRRRGMLGW
jgi:hypothetical protein